MKREEFLSDLEVNIKKINDNIAIGLSVNKIAPELFGCREDNIRKWLKDVGYSRDKNSKLFVVNKPTTSNIKAVGDNTTKTYNPVIKTNKSSYKPPVIESIKSDYESVIDSNKPAYNIEKSELQEDDIMKTTLLEFKDLPIQQKIILVNEKAMGKKTLTEMSNEGDEGFDFNVSNYMKQYHKGEVLWDGTVKCYKFIGGHQEPNFNEEEIDILKSFIERQKAIKTLLDDASKGEDKVHSIRCYSNIYSNFKEVCEMQNIRMQDALYIALNDYISKK